MAHYFGTSGIFSQYKRLADRQLRRNFMEAEKKENKLREGQAHQTNTTAELSEEMLPLYAKQIFKYFDFLDNCATTLAAA